MLIKNCRTPINWGLKFVLNECGNWKLLTLTLNLDYMENVPCTDNLVFHLSVLQRVATRLPRLDAANCKTQEPVWTSKSSSRWGWGPERRTCSSKCNSVTAKAVICILYWKYLVLVAHISFWYCDISLSMCSTDVSHIPWLLYHSMHLNFSKP